MSFALSWIGPGDTLARMTHPNSWFRDSAKSIFGIGVLAFGFGLSAAEPKAASKPVFVYSRYFNAEGEQRYQPDGTYSDVLHRLRDEFDVQVHNQALTPTSLDKAVGPNPPPHHFSSSDIQALAKFVERGGGLILMANQENHNLEVEDTNKLLARFGIQFTNLYTDAKKLVLPKDAPVVGGLRWAYYTGNLLLLDAKAPAKPRALVTNDLAQKPAKGPRDQPGVLLAAAELGRGRVVVVTDSGWITNDAFSEKGIGDVAIKGQDNWEIFRRLTRWAAHLPGENTN